jgi:hypothetical protein
MFTLRSVVPSLPKKIGQVRIWSCWSATRSGATDLPPIQRPSGAD